MSHNSGDNSFYQNNSKSDDISENRSIVREDDTDFISFFEDSKPNANFDSNNENDDLLISDEPVNYNESMDKWKIMIVDDEEDIHVVTKIALDNFLYKGKGLEFISAYSGSEARIILERYKNIAVILLDVVMETNTSGLDLVKYIRENLDNSFVRIILRTGQPGHAPEREIIEKYGINDYKMKTELYSQKLYSVVMTSLRTYESLMDIESNRQLLEYKVYERTKALENQKNALILSEKNLKDANILKLKLISLLADNLRNPLQSISIVSYLLVKKLKSLNSADSEEHSYISEIHNTIIDLTLMTEKILLWLRIQNNELILKPEIFDISMTANQIAAIFQEEANKKNISIIQEITENAMVSADPEFCSIVMRNIVENSVKYTNNDGQIILQSNPKSRTMEISIEDNGIGMSEIQLLNLFNFDAERKTGEYTEKKTAGLGLIICKELLSKMGCNFIISSESGKGSKFTIIFPVGN